MQAVKMFKQIRNFFFIYEKRIGHICTYDAIYVKHSIGSQAQFECPHFCRYIFIDVVEIFKNFIFFTDVDKFTSITLHFSGDRAAQLNLHFGAAMHNKALISCADQKGVTEVQ